MAAAAATLFARSALRQPAAPGAGDAVARSAPSAAGGPAGREVRALSGDRIVIRGARWRKTG